MQRAQFKNLIKQALLLFLRIVSYAVTYSFLKTCLKSNFKFINTTLHSKLESDWSESQPNKMH